MRWTRFALLALSVGCSSYDATQPQVPLAANPGCTATSQSPACLSIQAWGAVAGFVLNDADDCIIGAKVVVVDGMQAGASFTQTVCGFWDYADDIGYSFLKLPIGTPVKLRATAEGYETGEITAFPSNPFQYTTYIRLKEKQSGEL